MNRRRLVIMIGVVSVAALLAASIPVTQVKAGHDHSSHNRGSTPPTPAKKPPRPRAPNPVRQRTRTRVPSTVRKPTGTGVSSFEHKPVSSETLSLEEIYSRDFPMAIISIGEAVKAIQSGDRQTELAELGKALDKLLTVYKALGTHVKPQFANSLRCPIMGSPIDISMVDESLTRDYKGRKVAFCCAGCPSAWDELSDPQKQAKVPGVKF